MLYNSKGDLLKEYDIKQKGSSESDSIRKIIYFDGKIFALQEKYESGKPSNELYIMAYSLNGDIQPKKLDAEVKDIYNFTGYKEDKILIFTISSCFIYDYKNNKITELNKRLPRGNGYFYNVDEDIIYVVEKGQITKIPL